MTRKLTLLVAALGALAIPGSAPGAYPGSNGRIAYVAGNRIVSVSPNGTGAAYLTAKAARAGAPSWSRDGTNGTTIVFQAGGRGSSISTIPIGGGTPTGAVNGSTGSAPAWQPIP